MSEVLSPDTTALTVQASASWQAFSPNSNCSMPGDCPDGGAYNFTVLCGVPAGDQAVVPAVLAQPPQNDDSSTGMGSTPMCHCWMFSVVNHVCIQRC